VQPGEAIKRLTQEVQDKQEIVAQLEQEKEELVYRQLLLNAVLNAFSLVLGSRASAAEQQLLLQLDGLHLQPCSSSSSSISCSASFPVHVHGLQPSQQQLAQLWQPSIEAGQQQAAVSAHSTIADEGDPLRLMSLLPHTQLDAASITLQQLQQGYQCTISTLAANIGLLEQQPQHQQDASIPTSSSPLSSSSDRDDAAAAAAAVAAAALSNIQGALQGYWATLNVLLRGGRGELTHAYIISNVLTGECAVACHESHEIHRCLSAPSAGKIAVQGSVTSVYPGHVVLTSHGAASKATHPASFSLPHQSASLRVPRRSCVWGVENTAHAASVLTLFCNIVTHSKCRGAAGAARPAAVPRSSTAAAAQHSAAAPHHHCPALLPATYGTSCRSSPAAAAAAARSTSCRSR
jgi:hypothetical protein